VSSPSDVAPSKNSTLATVPSLSAAVAVSASATPVLPVAGAARVTVGGTLPAEPASPPPPPQAARKANTRAGK
jgi:hypothetical protein